VKFKKMQPRSDWREKAKELGYMAALFDDPPYWIEATADPYCAVFSHAEIENIIEPATRELNELALQAVELVCFGPKSEELMEKLHIPQAFREPIRQSWKRRDRSLYGRFDFSYNNDQLKLLELNFDTAISLYEASIFQLLWFEDLRASGKLPEDCDQFNVIHEQLLRAFSGVAGGDFAIHFTSMEHSEEDEDTTKYLQSCAVLAGVPSKFMHLHELGYDEAGNLIDKEGLTIRNLLSLGIFVRGRRSDSPGTRQICIGPNSRRGPHRLYRAGVENNSIKQRHPSYSLGNGTRLPLASGKLLRRRTTGCPAQETTPCAQAALRQRRRQHLDYISQRAG
jgi:glutathionylspermidine synthase